MSDAGQIIGRGKRVVYGPLQVPSNGGLKYPCEECPQRDPGPRDCEECEPYGEYVSKLFYCPYCSERFTSEPQLDRHILSFHTGTVLREEGESARPGGDQEGQLMVPLNSERRHRLNGDEVTPIMEAVEFQLRQLLEDRKDLPMAEILFRARDMVSPFLREMLVILKTRKNFVKK